MSPGTALRSSGSVAGRAAAFGAAAALGHAPFGLWPVAVVGVVWLLWEVSRSGRPTLAGWTAGVGYFGVALHWIVEPFLVEPDVHGWMAPFALILMAGGLALFWALAGWIAARLYGVGPGTATDVWAVALLLSGVEMSRAYVFTGFPWALPAYVWADTGVRLTAAWIGPHGLTLLTLVAAAGVVNLLAAIQAGDGTGRTARAMPFVALAAPFALAAWPVVKAAAPETGPVIRLVQPNAPQDEKWHPDTAGTFVRRMIDFTAAGDPPDLTVWPEAAVPYALSVSDQILIAAADAARGGELITGINRQDGDDWYNSLVVVGANGAVGETFDKVHLVPFGEYIPGRIDLIRAMAARSTYGFSAGAEVRLIETAAGAALPLICYEAIFPQHLRRVTGRADYILQITNDAWFGTFSGPYQHLDQARFRAVETGLPLVRVANTGVSAVIDPYGNVLTGLPLGESGWVDARLPAAAAPTLYAKLGDLPVACALLLALAALSAGKVVASRRDRA